MPAAGRRPPVTPAWHAPDVGLRGVGQGLKIAGCSTTGAPAIGRCGAAAQGSVYTSKQRAVSPGRAQC